MTTAPNLLPAATGAEPSATLLRLRAAAIEVARRRLWAVQRQARECRRPRRAPAWRAGLAWGAAALGLAAALAAAALRGF